MKKMYFLVMMIFLGLSISTSAQLNYFFSASTKPYVPVSNGIVPHLQTDNPFWDVEDEGFARVPIGFNFKYDGQNYSHANLQANGFITLKDSLNIFYNYPYYQNLLKNAPPYNKRPILAAFWDDLILPDAQSLVYKTTGTAPYRVFTVEWKKAKWVYESPGPVLSIELKLYETTNVIEFHYKDEANLPDPRYSYASIGITSDYANRGFISLQSISANPEISFVKANDSLHVKPANNQVYSFKPSLVPIPVPLQQSFIYNQHKLAFRLPSNGFLKYEYAITQSPIPPSSGKIILPEGDIVSSLNPATTYYFYARNTLFGYINSQWTCDSFTTAVLPVKLPYTASLDGVNYPPNLPVEMRQQDFRDTSFWNSPDNGFIAFSDFPDVGDVAFGYFQTDLYDADNWLFTPGFKFEQGKTYNLKFGYYALYDYTEGDIASMEVKYGRATGAGAMTKGALFSKSDIGSPYVGDDIVRADTTIEITADTTGNYYIGFHNLSTQLQAGLVITNISVSEKMPALTEKLLLTGKTEIGGNILSWNNTEKNNANDFIIESSENGIDFKKVGNFSAQKKNYALTFKRPDIKTTSNKSFINAAGKIDKQSKMLANNKPELFLQNGNSPINFKNLLTSNQNNLRKNQNENISLNFKDAHPQIGATYYRMSQVKNGNTDYSNIIKLEKILQVDGVYPNPARELLTIKIKSIANVKQRVLITDASGKLLFTKEIALSIGINNIQLSVINLRANTYFIKIIDNENRTLAIEKFVKL